MKKFNFKMLFAVIVAMLLVLVSIPVAFAEPSPTASPTGSPTGSPFATETPEVAKATAVDANGEEVNVDLTKVTITPVGDENGDPTTDIALKLKKLLEDAGYETVLTRNDDNSLDNKKTDTLK